MKKAYLVLQNGRVFAAERFGADGETMAELVFTTGMVGYLETLTDPCYLGQMVVHTFPLIGNYGVIPQDFASPHPRLAAYIVRQACDTPSNFRSQGDLDGYLRAEGVIGLQGVDTRALTRVIRESGVMNAAIVNEMPKDLETLLGELRAFRPANGVELLSCQAPYLFCEGGKHVALWDFGHADQAARALKARGLKVSVVPAAATAAEILALKPDGVLLAEGPGDPADNAGVIEQLRLLNKAQLPTLGIGLGHQLLALSRGAKTIKLPYGHRGDNQPVRALPSGRLYTTHQNHGYAVATETLPAAARVTDENCNDHTCEGIAYDDMPAVSVQFHPDSGRGTGDGESLFDQFVKMMEVHA